MSIQPSKPVHRQHTLARSVHCRGRGLHSARHVRLILHPAPVGAGIVFRRSDLPAAAGEIDANWRRIVDSSYCTILGNDQGTRVRTVEHLLAALYALRIDNAVVELDGEELPILDGSAAPFLELLDEAGVQAQQASRRFLKILRPMEIRSGPAIRRLVPGKRFLLSVTCRLPEMGPQRWTGAVTPETFRQEIAPARAWGRLNTLWPVLLLGKLRLVPYLRGASLGNAILIAGGRVINRGGLRMEGEFARHRALDLLGDIALAGAPILGRLAARRGNHLMNAQLLRSLFAQPEAWEWVTGQE